jgi:hypothetical protein
LPLLRLHACLRASHILPFLTTHPIPEISRQLNRSLTRSNSSLQALARRQLVELKNGRLAMIATAGMLHHYFLTGKGPIELITG